MYFRVVEGEELYGLVVEVEEVCFFLVVGCFLSVAWVVSSGPLPQRAQSGISAKHAL